MGKIAYFVVAGQSLAADWFNQPGALDAFRTEFLTQNTAYTDVQFFKAAVGGTAMLKQSALDIAMAKDMPSLAQKYFYDEATKSDGPKLGQFVKPLQAWAKGKTVLGIIWDQGQSDTQTVITPEFANTYTAGLDYVLNRLMTLSGAKRVYIEAFGDRGTYTAKLHGGSDLMHAIQQEFVRNHSYAVLATTTFDLPLRDPENPTGTPVHLTIAGTITSVQRMADAISTGLFSPYAGHAVLARDGTIYVSIDLKRAQSLEPLGSLAGFTINGVLPKAVAIDPAASVIKITPATSGAEFSVAYASAQYSFNLVGSDLLVASGKTGLLPVQPFDRAVTQGGVDIKPNIYGGYLMVGTSAADALQGFRSTDTLKGGAGSDILDGGGGNDRLYGGAGDDSFVFRAGMGIDKVFDFSPSSDHILLVDRVYADLTIAAYGTDSTMISGPGGARMVLAGVLPSQLGEMDITTVHHVDGMIF